eukprot:CAMPEP_0177773154 /NCGR_PEP_ID=MMETSP0491_2-20121128/12674_1 /TAXON_ID=63592 /ORGANISM="Tetraselmis chuii, Strain PLY429" /LENGTH=248 /DNA_ID=CAMNT_0019291151 /DNA_START=209 /DNA_END=955 /DNA_ORIENTATION=+
MCHPVKTVQNRLDRLRLALAQYNEHGFEVVSCMRRLQIESHLGHGNYEPANGMFGSDKYHTFPLGSFYVLANKVVKMISSVEDPTWLRHLANEDSMLGAWMLSFNVKPFDDRRLCTMKCLPVTVATAATHFTHTPNVFSYHESCSNSSTVPRDFSELPILRPSMAFTANETDGLPVFSADPWSTSLPGERPPTAADFHFSRNGGAGERPAQPAIHEMIEQRRAERERRRVEMRAERLAARTSNHDSEE